MEKNKLPRRGVLALTALLAVLAGALSLCLGAAAVPAFWVQAVSRERDSTEVRTRADSFMLFFFISFISF